MLDWGRFAVLTFDCYGTLIDWETGILNALRPVLAAHGCTPESETILETFGLLEAKAEAGEYKSYKDILRLVMAGFGESFEFTPTDQELELLVRSLKDWPPFPDTVQALRDLSAKHRLAIISNTDNDLFAETAKTLQVPFAEVITAEMTGSYKPSRTNFELALDIIPVGRHKILHVAQSLYHDVVPAKSLGLATVWVNRRAGRKGSGATLPATATPDLEVPDLQTLAVLVGR